jgi:double-stranded uracil-DNA glycosylase
MSQERGVRAPVGRDRRSLPVVDRETVEVYEREAARWIERRSPVDRERAAAFGERVRSLDGGGSPCADLGCGPGWYSDQLPQPLVVLDAVAPMVREARARGAALAVQGDLEALPVRTGALGSAWASKSYVHVPRTALPMALADLHRACRVGAPIHLRLFGGDREHAHFAGDDFPGRRFSAWQQEHLREVVLGAGFLLQDLEVVEHEAGEVSLVVEATRARTLPDVVGAGMRLLVCGLNPSLYAADRGVGYARPGNRFWPAALSAGIVSVDRDPAHALRHHGVGITDLVKRATVGASELDRSEYAAGFARLDRLCRWLRPGAVVFVGLAGWRAAVDRRARPGVQPDRIGGVPAYVMPSTSGLNARVPVDELADHLRAAARVADDELARRRATGS